MSKNYDFVFEKADIDDIDFYASHILQFSPKVLINYANAEIVQNYILNAENIRETNGWQYVEQNLHSIMQKLGENLSFLCRESKLLKYIIYNVVKYRYARHGIFDPFISSMLRKTNDVQLLIHDIEQELDILEKL